MTLFFRVFQHLLPRGAAWRTTVQKTLRSFFEGLSEAPAQAREFIDAVWSDAFPETTRELGTWENQFGITPASTESARRQNLTGEWRAQGGQSPRYLQDVVQAHGFDLYLHEWWDPNGSLWQQTQCGDLGAECGEPNAQCAERTFRPVRNPQDWTDQPLIGLVQCGEDLAQCGEPTALCNNFLANDPGYLVNKNLSNEAPPRAPDDPLDWAYFLYWGPEEFPAEPGVGYAEVPAERRAELEALVLKICPTEQWLVMLVEYVE